MYSRSESFFLTTPQNAASRAPIKSYLYHRTKITNPDELLLPSGYPEITEIFIPSMGVIFNSERHIFCANEAICSGPTTEISLNYDLAMRINRVARTQTELCLLKTLLSNEHDEAIKEEYQSSRSQLQNKLNEDFAWLHSNAEFNSLCDDYPFETFQPASFYG